MSDIMELVERLKHLTSLNEAENGGPYGGYAAAECIRAMSEAAATIERLVSRCERLEEALKPFADQADELNEASPDNRDIWENPVAMSITFGDLRRAREALEPKP